MIFTFFAAGFAVGFNLPQLANAIMFCAETAHTVIPMSLSLQIYEERKKKQIKLNITEITKTI